MLFTCCSNPDHIVRSFAHDMSSYSSHTAVRVEWECVSCGAKIEMSNLHDDYTRMDMLHRAMERTRQRENNWRSPWSNDFDNEANEDMKMAVGTVIKDR